MPLLPPPTLRPWRRTGAERVARYRVFGVDRVTMDDGDGRPRGDAYVLDCRDWCNVVALTGDDEIVLVWQYRFGTETLSLEIPGGVVDPGEAPADTAARELLEETGYVADGLEPLVVLEANPAIQNNRIHTYLARGARLAAETRFDAQEELETVLFPASRLGELLDGGEVRHALIRSPLELFWRRRASGLLLR